MSYDPTSWRESLRVWWRLRLWADYAIVAVVFLVLTLTVLGVLIWIKWVLEYLGAL